MEFNLTTPALLFPTISLLMLAYTNRFLTIATIIRNLHDRYMDDQSENLLGQIVTLSRLSDPQHADLRCNKPVVCVASMFALFAGWISAGQWSFAIALVLMIVSLGISLRELMISSGALDLLLTDLEKHDKSF